MREKQKKAQDKQAEMDAIRAKRDYEEAERKAILKEKEEEIIKQRKLMECIEDNENHKKVKEKQKADEIQREKDEYEKMKLERQREIEEEKDIQNLTDKYVGEVDNIVKAKESEVLEV